MVLIFYSNNTPSISISNILNFHYQNTVGKVRIRLLKFCHQILHMGANKLTTNFFIKTYATYHDILLTVAIKTDPTILGDTSNP